MVFEGFDGAGGGEEADVVFEGGEVDEVAVVVEGGDAVADFFGGLGRGFLDCGADLGEEVGGGFGEAVDVVVDGGGFGGRGFHLGGAIIFLAELFCALSEQRIERCRAGARGALALPRF